MQTLQRPAKWQSALLYCTCTTSVLWKWRRLVCLEVISLVKELSRRTVTLTGEPRSAAFLRQRIDIALQRGNAASIMGTLQHSRLPDEWSNIQGLMNSSIFHYSVYSLKARELALTWSVFALLFHIIITLWVLLVQAVAPIIFLECTPFLYYFLVI